MSLMILSGFLVALAWSPARSFWHLWSRLPQSNADFSLVDADTRGRP